MKTALVTGAGFIGNAITDRLVKMGVDVTVILSGGEETSRGVKKIIHTGLTGIDWQYLADAERYDVVFHQMANNDTLCKDHSEMMRANMDGPIELFQRMERNGCRNFVYASSTAVYGNSPAPYSEDSPIQTLNVYAKSKIEFDDFAMTFAERNKVKVTGLRYCNVYGNGESEKKHRMSMIGQLLRTMMKGNRPKVFEFGEQKRDWVYIDDVVEANLLSASRETDQYGDIYNIGYGAAWTFNEIIATINDIIERSLHPEYIYNFCADSYQTHTECDIRKAKAELGFRPKYDIKKGIRKYFECLS